MAQAVAILFLMTAAFGLAAEYPRAFNSNGQIWIQLTGSQSAFQATHNGTMKSDAHVSPDGKLIVYDVRESPGDNALDQLNIVFLDWSGKELRRFHEVPMKGLGSTCGYGDV